MLLFIDPPQHTRVRRLVAKAFTPRRIESLRPRLTEMIEGMLDRLQHRPSFDVMEEIAEPFPIMTITELLAVPDTDRRKLHDWTVAVAAVDELPIDLTVLESAGRAADEFLEDARRLVDARRAEPGDDLISALLLTEDEGERLTRDELLAMIVLLLVAGHDTTMSLISTGLWLLLQHPEAAEEVRHDPTAVAGAIEETLRFMGPLQVASGGGRWPLAPVELHPAPAIAYDGTDVSKPFDDDAWELYYVAEDFSEVHDLAATEPAKLEQMKQLWWEEAVKYQVLPLNNQPGRFADRRHRRNRHELHAGIGSLPEAIAPNLRGRRFFIAAELDVPATGDVEGAIVAHGSHSGGFVMFLRCRRLHYAYNFLGTEITVASASVALPPGPVVVRVAFTPTASKPGSGGDIALFYGDVPVGEATIARTTPLTYGSHGFAVGYQPGGPICAALPGRAEITPGVLGRVVIESEARPPRDAAARTRVDLATQ